MGHTVREIIVRTLDKVTPGTSRSIAWEFGIALVSFPASVLLNRTLGAEDRGLLALVVLVPTTIFVVGSCQWDRLLQGLITSKHSSSREIWRQTKYYSFWLSLIFVPFSIVCSLFYTQIPLDNRWLSMLYSLNFPIYFLCGCLASIYIASGNIDGQYWMRIALQGSYLIFSLGCWLTHTLSVQSMIAIYIIMHLASLVAGWRWIDRLLDGEIRVEIVPPITPLIKAFPPYLLESFSSRIDIWLLSLFTSLVTLGQYSGITALMMPVGLLSNAMTSASTARLDWQDSIAVEKYLYRTLVALSILLFILALGGISLGPYFLNLILGETFSRGTWMIPWIAAIVVTQAAAFQFHAALRLKGNSDTYLMIQSIEPFIKLCITFILGWKLAEIGIFLGLIVSSILKIGICFMGHRFSRENKNLA